MHNEEFERNFERKVEFIVNQQAQFAVDIQRLEEAQAVTEKKVAHAVEAAAHASEAAERYAERTAKNIENVTSLVLEGFRVVAERFKDTDVKINALVDSQMLTDEKLRELDRRTRKGHKGHNGAP
jgi:hypothetical protein